MEISKYDVYAYQILHYLVTTHHYQIIRVEPHKEDLWLAHPNAEHYPVIRICSSRMEDVDETVQYLRQVHRTILDLIHREGPLLLLNTCPDCFLLDNPLIKQVRITPHKISDAQILKTFKKLDEVVHEVDDPGEEMARLARSIEEAQLSAQKKFMHKAKKRLRPSVTMTIIAICILYFLAAFILAMTLQDLPVSWIAAGAFYKMNIVAAHEYWRLLTAGFLHGDVLTLLYTMYVLYQAGKLCEPIFTKRQYLILLIGSIFCGYVCMLISDPNAIAFGIGSGIWGIVGAFLVSVVENGTIRLPLVKYSVLKLLLLSLFVWLLPGQSILGHLGGLICGSLMSMAFLRSYKWPQLRKHAKNAGILLLAVLSVLGFRVQRVEPVNQEMDQRIVAVFSNPIFESYAQYLKSCYNKQYRWE